MVAIFGPASRHERGAPHLLVHRGVRQIDENPAGEAVARERSDLRALVEAVLEDLVGLELDGERLVDFPPQQLVALHAGGVAGFREAVRHWLHHGSRRLCREEPYLTARRG